ncbi:hypothetical protein IIB34_01575 [PVC group bacterium]|nr:hypothetical protein [PVC group bacterium]
MVLEDVKKELIADGHTINTDIGVGAMIEVPSAAMIADILAKEVDCTYSHAVKILQTLEELSLVVFEKRGRIKVIQLTKKGREVADAIENIQKLIK